MPDNSLEWHKILEIDDNLTEGFVTDFYFKSKKYLCFYFEGEFHVVHEKCPHNGAKLSLSGFNPMNKTITCPLHRYCFDILSGKLLSGADACHLEKLPVRIHQGKLYLGTPRPWWKF
ncbi:MAG: Rieske 2Fe-2S domain-containing protein [Bacteroidia bacterium]|nr:Rieske 2Fe-2S domain-containing protein [Bacteroidia bacterium]